MKIRFSDIQNLCVRLVLHFLRAAVIVSVLTWLASQWIIVYARAQADWPIYRLDFFVVPQGYLLLNNPVIGEATLDLKSGFVSDGYHESFRGIISVEDDDVIPFFDDAAINWWHEPAPALSLIMYSNGFVSVRHWVLVVISSALLAMGYLYKHRSAFSRSRSNSLRQ